MGKIVAILVFCTLALSTGCGAVTTDAVMTSDAGSGATGSVRTTETVLLSDSEAETSGGDETAAEAPLSTALDTADPAGSADGRVVNLIFIHHSVGENWLNDGLCGELNDRGYHVADIYYGWRGYGDHTDTTDWPVWFTDEVMELVYQETDAMTAPNTLEPAEGENTIVMFKSCFPSSDVGSDASDEMAVYEGLLPYFAGRFDKVFILVTPPPMIDISDPSATRGLCDWLADRDTGWLSSLSTGNVFVFDLYNVLTHPDAHHHVKEGREVHESVAGHDTLYYDSDGDDHPNRQGNLKAAYEFVGLLDLWFEDFSQSRD